MQIKTQILITAILLISTLNAISQTLPELSDAENPVWYYIKVKGTSERTARIFKNTNNDIYGNFVYNITTDAGQDNCLWRFEKNSSGYILINKGTGKNLSVRTAGDIEANLQIASFDGDAGSDIWQIIPYEDSFQIQSASGKYLHQADNYNNRSYVIMLTDDTWKNSSNSLYSFVLYNPAFPEKSDFEQHWYYIFSGKNGYETKCITDLDNNTDDKVKFELQNRIKNNNHQLWKMIVAPQERGNNVCFINKATGNIIRTNYDFNGYYCVQSTTDAYDTNGWRLIYTGEGQFLICGLNDIGVTGFLNAASSNESPEYISEGKDIINSAYTWTFKKEDSPTDGIKVDDAVNDIIVYSCDRKIYVEGCSDYTITHITGMRMNAGAALPVGVYLVTTPHGTMSVVVR